MELPTCHGFVILNSFTNNLRLERIKIQHIK
jgi:hypothetical protein